MIIYQKIKKNILLPNPNPYKIILDCKTELEGFYMKYGFNNRNIQMSIYY